MRRRALLVPLPLFVVKPAPPLLAGATSGGGLGVVELTGGLVSGGRTCVAVVVSIDSF